MKDPSSGPSGRLLIRLSQTGVGKPATVAIRSSRPLSLPDIFLGQSPEILLTMLPRLYSICAGAHAMAAVCALEQAMDRPAHPHRNQARQILVELETLREHLWRIYLGWPTFYGDKPEPGPVARITGLQQQLEQALSGGQNLYTLENNYLPPETDFRGANRAIGEIGSCIETELLHMPLPRWQHDLPEEHFRQWIRDSASPAARFLAYLQQKQWETLGDQHFAPLPPLTDRQLDMAFSRGDAIAFTSQPDWLGTPRETGVLARQKYHPAVKRSQQTYGNGLMTRLTARLHEVTDIPLQMQQRLQAMEFQARQLQPPDGSLPAGTGISQVEAARGRLIHYLRLAADGSVAQYHVVAPTEWNFHPAGCAARALSTINAPAQQMETKARLLVEAIDPCVEYHLEFA